MMYLQIGFDTAENEPLKVWRLFYSFIRSRPYYWRVFALRTVHWISLTSLEPPLPQIQSIFRAWCKKTQCTPPIAHLKSCSGTALPACVWSWGPKALKDSCFIGTLGYLHCERENFRGLVLDCVEANLCNQIFVGWKALAEIHIMHSVLQLSKNNFYFDVAIFSESCPNVRKCNRNVSKFAKLWWDVNGILQEFAEFERNLTKLASIGRIL